MSSPTSPTSSVGRPSTWQDRLQGWSKYFRAVTITLPQNSKMFVVHIRRTLSIDRWFNVVFLLPVFAYSGAFANEDGSPIEVYAMNMLSGPFLTLTFQNRSLRPFSSSFANLHNSF